MIRRKKMTIFTDAKDDTTVLELKKMIEGNFTLTIPQNCVTLCIRTDGLHISYVSNFLNFYLSFK